MYQGTTPAITYTISGVDVTAMKAYVSFKYGSNLLTKTYPDVQMDYDSTDNVSTVVCLLSQSETLEMTKGSCITQIRFIASDGSAYATNKGRITVDDVIYRQIITYGGD